MCLTLGNPRFGEVNKQGSLLQDYKVEVHRISKSKRMVPNVSQTSFTMKNIYTS